VVLDASWTDRYQRAAAVAVAQDTSSGLIELECSAPHDVSAERLRQRASAAADVSDASPAVAAAMAATADPWPSARSVNTTAPPDETLSSSEAVVRDLLSPAPSQTHLSS
jgi:uncharacterized protein